MSFNFPTAPPVNRQQAMLAGGGVIAILLAVAWFFFVPPADDAPASDTPAVSAGARARAARDAAIRKRQAAGGAGAGAAVAQAGATKDSSIVVMREDFAYEPAGRRDPFLSLMGTEDIGPAVADLILTGILWHPTRPVAVIRQTTGEKQQYRVTIGSVLGRMRVTQIKPKTVIFTIEEFGFNRRDSLILGDTTQVRAR
ncbi:MAG: hypothetical protein ACYC3Q_09795 [Gemmatimonadaceae bacterium]